MLRQIFEMILEQLDKRDKRSLVVDDKFVKLVKEVNELEEEYIEALAEAERFGDLTDNANWRTVEVNKRKRVLEAKQRMLDTLKNNS